MKKMILFSVVFMGHTTFAMEKAKVRTTTIFEAAEKGDLKRVQEILAQGVSINSRDKYGNTPLMWAIASRKDELAEFLIKKDVDVTVCRKRHQKRRRKKTDGFTFDLSSIRLITADDICSGWYAGVGVNALLLAAKFGSKKIIKMLLKAGSDAQLKDCNGDNALMYAARENRAEVVECLVSHSNVNEKNDKGWTPLMVSVNAGRGKKKALSTLKILLKAGANINEKDSKGRTALMVAASHRVAKEVLRELLKARANIHEKDAKGRTALMIAAKKGNVSGLKALLKAGANMFEKDGRGRSVVCLLRTIPKEFIWDAIKRARRKSEEIDCGISEIVRECCKLKREGVKENDTLSFIRKAYPGIWQRVTVPALRSRAGRAVEKLEKRIRGLVKMMKQGNLEIVNDKISWDGKKWKPITSFLLNSSDQNGMTLLMHATQLGSFEMCHKLLKNGAKVGIKDKNGKAVIDMAGELNYKHLLPLFKFYLDECTSGKTKKSSVDSLFDAAKLGDIEEIICFLRDEVSIDITDENGFTPLMYAIEGNQEKAIEFLINAGANVNVRTNHGSSVFHFLPNNEGILEMLLDAGAEGIFEKNNQGWTALMMASYKGHLEIVRKLVEIGANINETANAGYTALMIAVESGHKHIVIELAKKADKEAKRGGDGLTALMLAAKEGFREIVQELLSAGANINEKTADGKTALMCAAFRGKKEVVVELIKEGAQVNEKTVDGVNALMAAVQEGVCNGVVTELIKAGADVNEKSIDGLSALAVAVSNDEKELVVELISFGVDVDVKDNDGNTPLMLAAYNGYTDIVNLLLDAGADIDKKNNDDLTALHAAIENNKKEVVVEFAKMLGVDATDDEGLTILMRAAQNGHKELVNSLVCEADALIDKETDLGLTALMFALAEGCEGTALELIKLGADIYTRSNAGLTALMIAAETGLVKVVEKLLENDVFINEKNNAGLTPLMHAARNGQTEVIDQLIKAGAVISETNANGRTALMCAAGGGHMKAVTQLLRAGADLGAKDINGETTITLAANWGITLYLCELKTDIQILGMGIIDGDLKGVSELLWWRGFLVNSPCTKQGGTPLCLAAQVGNFEICYELLKRGARIHHQNKKGETAIDLAKNLGHEAIVELLQAYSKSTLEHRCLMRLLELSPEEKKEFLKSLTQEKRDCLMKLFPSLAAVFKEEKGCVIL